MPLPVCPSASIHQIHGLQDQSLDAFAHIMERAIVFAMPRLSACCECHISIDPKQRLQPVSLRLKHLLPASSAVRIAEGLHMAFSKVASEHATPDWSLGCDCTCCHRNKVAYKKVKACACPKKGLAHAEFKHHVPSPKEYLALAQRQG